MTTCSQQVVMYLHVRVLSKQTQHSTRACAIAFWWWMRVRQMVFVILHVVSMELARYFILYII
jgi:hypothetical protein